MFVMSDDVYRLQQLELEESALRELLHNCQLSDFTRPQVEDLIRIVHDEIEREREALKRSGQAA
jgi:hypothetical protein